MSPQSKSSLVKLGPFDGVLALLAIIGILAFVFILPSQHIDGLASYGLTEDQAVDRANVFLVSNGYSVEGLAIRATLTRNQRLLEGMQRDLGRAQTIQILRDDTDLVLPAFLWSVVYRLQDPDMISTFSLLPVERVFRIYLSEDGDVLAFENQGAETGSELFGDATTSVNRTILSRLLAPDDSLENATLNRLRALSDSTLISNLRFGLIQTEAVPNRPASGSAIDRMDLLERGDYVALDSMDVMSLAELHAPNRAFQGVEWRIDSLLVLPSGSARLAWVRLLTTEPIYGQHFRVDMTLSSTGNLQQMDVLSNPGRDEGTLVDSTLDAVKVGLYVLLVIFLAVLFVKRIVARLIDVKGAMLDALLLGFLVGLYLVLRQDLGFNGDLSGWGRIGASAIIFSISGGATALFVFVVAAATESVTREVLPEKIHATTLLRRGDVHNQLVGRSLLRGVGFGGLLLGMGVLALVLFPFLTLSISKPLAVDTSFRPVVSALAGGMIFAYLSLLMVILGIGTYAYRAGSKFWLLIAAVSVTGGILQIAPIGLTASWSAVAVSAAVAFVLGLAYARYDFLTAVTALFVCSLMWGAGEGFLIAHSPAWIDTLLASLLTATIGVFGIAGVLSKQTGGSADQYVPHYISEMAGQERIKRELEIAYQVQASFLPRTMPNIDGLDLAGMCLPASEIGGDYFDFIQLPNGQLAFVVGDVSGKGIQAAFYMTLVKGVIQTLSTGLPSPKEVMQRLNQVFRRNAPAGTFISAIYGVVEPSTGKFTFARAGHNPAILKRAESPEPEALRPTGMAIGFTDGKVFEESIKEVSIQLEPGDALVFYTDGFSEAMNSKRELYGDDRLLRKVGQVGTRSASGILRALTEDVHHFIESAGRSDDMTMIVLKRNST